MPSVLLGIATVPAVIALGTWLFDRRVGLVAGLLLALSVYHVNYSQDARAYSLIVATSTAQYALLVAFRRSGRIVWLAAFSLLALVSVYSHHMGLLVQAALGATSAALLLLDARREGVLIGVELHTTDHFAEKNNLFGDFLRGQVHPPHGCHKRMCGRGTHGTSE